MVGCKIELPYTDENKTVRIIFSSCQHFGSSQFSRRHFLNFIREELAKPQSYLILMGDTFDAVVNADFKRFTVSCIDPKYLLKGPDQFINLALIDAADMLEPYKDKIIGGMMGNHEYEFLKRYNINLTAMFCERLGIRNLGMCFLMRLLLKRDGANNRVRSVKIFAHHGYGGSGRTAGARMTKYEKEIKKFPADIYAFGHDHESETKKMARLDVNSKGRIYDRPYMLVVVGSFKKSLSDNEIPTWEETRLLGPNILNGAIVELTVDSDNWVKLQGWP